MQMARFCVFVETVSNVNSQWLGDYSSWQVCHVICSMTGKIIKLFFGYYLMMKMD